MSDDATLKVNNQTLELSGNAIHIISLRHIVEIVKGELEPVRSSSRPVIFFAIVGIVALIAAAITRDDEPIAGICVVTSAIAFVMVLLILLARFIKWCTSKREYGLFLCDVGGGWFMITSKSDQSVTNIMEEIVARLESDQQMPSVAFDIENLDMRDQSTKNINTQFVKAGRDANIGNVKQQA